MPNSTLLAKPKWFICHEFNYTEDKWFGICIIMLHTVSCFSITSWISVSCCFQKVLTVLISVNLHCWMRKVAVEAACLPVDHCLVIVFSIHPLLFPYVLLFRELCHYAKRLNTGNVDEFIRKMLCQKMCFPFWALIGGCVMLNAKPMLKVFNVFNEGGVWSDLLIRFWDMLLNTSFGN